jgi:hypothetical protein
VWLPLAYLAEGLGRRLLTAKLSDADIASLSRSERLKVIATLAGPQLLALVIAGGAGGFLATRFGTGTKRRDAAFAGLAVGLVALGLTYAQVGVSIAALIVPCLAAGSAALGGHLGVPRRDL